MTSSRTPAPRPALTLFIPRKGGVVLAGNRDDDDLAIDGQKRRVGAQVRGRLDELLPQPWTVHCDGHRPADLTAVFDNLVELFVAVLRQTAIVGDQLDSRHDGYRSALETVIKSSVCSGRNCWTIMAGDSPVLAAGVSVQ